MVHLRHERFKETVNLRKKILSMSCTTKTIVVCYVPKVRFKYSIMYISLYKETQIYFLSSIYKYILNIPFMTEQKRKLVTHI